MLTPYEPTKFLTYDLTNYNIRYTSTIDGKIRAIFIANYKDDVLSHIETYILPSDLSNIDDSFNYEYEYSFLVSKDLINFYYLLYGKYNPKYISFSQHIGNMRALNLMKKLTKKFNYSMLDRKVLPKNIVRFVYKKVDNK